MKEAFTTETQRAQRTHRDLVTCKPLCSLCALCVSVVNHTVTRPQVQTDHYPGFICCFASARLVVQFAANECEVFFV
jgi:hypothetical protein